MLLGPISNSNFAGFLFADDWTQMTFDFSAFAYDLNGSAGAGADFDDYYVIDIQPYPFIAPALGDIFDATALLGDAHDTYDADHSVVDPAADAVLL